MPVHCHADAEVAGWQNVAAPQTEHKKHVRRPYADALHLREVLDDLVVRHFVNARKIQFASMCALGHVYQIRRFLSRQARGPHLLLGQLQDSFRRERISGKIGKALENRRSRFSVELLIGDGLGQIMEGRFVEAHAAGTNALDDRAQHRVGLLEVQDSFTHGPSLEFFCPCGAEYICFLLLPPLTRWAALFRRFAACAHQTATSGTLCAHSALLLLCREIHQLFERVVIVRADAYRPAIDEKRRRRVHVEGLAELD